MPISSELIQQFVKSTKTTSDSRKETTVYGTMVDSSHVQIDGSKLITPVDVTANAKADDRVTVLIKNHRAIVTGNLTSPSTNTLYVDSVNADKVTTNQLQSEFAVIDNLYAHKLAVDGQFEAQNGVINNLKTNKLDANDAKLTYATIENLKATNGEIDTLKTVRLSAIEGTIKNLNSTYANIDFTNIGKAAMEYFYANSGLIKDVVVGDQTITGQLIGVTINGDRIIGNTIIAEKLVIKGSDGLYYKLNTDGMKVEANQTDQNSLNGQIIKAKSITATKIAVDDLVAFGATIGGFHITDSSLYSGVKESVDNTTRGIYLGKDGQMSVGDSSNFIKYYKDTDGKYKLAISVDSLSISSGADIGTALENIQNGIDSIKIGGRNYAANTTNKWSGEYIVSGWQNYRYSGTDVSHIDLVGQTVTFSGYIENLSGADVGIMLHIETPDDERGFWQASSDVKVSEGSSGFVAKTVVVPEHISMITDVKLALRHYSSTDANTTAKIRSWKLEKGTKATDWTPAPEDIDSSISNVYTAIDDVDVGGRNLILDSGFSTTEQTNVWTTENGIATGVGTIGDTSATTSIFLPLSDYALRACRNRSVVITLEYFVEKEITFGATKPWVGAELSFVRDESTGGTSQYLNWYGLKRFPTAVTSKWQRYSIKVQVTDYDIVYGGLCIYIRDSSGILKIRHPKVEIGDKATDWTPAPEDVDLDIAEAAKTATNFIYWDSSNGLQVGDKRSGSWVGFRTQITNAAFNILSAAGTTLASYGEKIIELGKNATDAVIKFCGGKGQIEYVEDYLQLSADSVRLKGKEVASLYSNYTDSSGVFRNGAVHAAPGEVNVVAGGDGSNSSVNVKPTSIQMTTNNFYLSGTMNDSKNGGTYVSVTTGTSGIWTYKKFSDGYLEMWGTYAVSNMECTNAMGGMYRTAVFSPTAFPFTVYNPNVVASYESEGYGAFLWATTNTTTAKPPNYYLVRPTSTTIANGKIIFHVCGRWKT